MAPVEGEKYTAEIPVGEIDSTLPGEIQELHDFHPTILEVSCDPEDNFGTLKIHNETLSIKVSKLTQIEGKPEPIQDLQKPLIFSGNESIFVARQENHLTETVVLRHKKGEAE